MTREIRSAKLEIPACGRQAKQIPMTKIQNSRPCRLENLDIGILDLFRASIFEFRIFEENAHREE